jgi:predicted AAA+ superfamily ATPase
VKESQHPKLYLFDPGVARSLGGRLREPLDSAERGPLLETVVLHELRSYLNVSGCAGELYYWATPSGQEVDIVWQRGTRRVGIEVKSTGEWRREYSRALRGLLEQQMLSRGYGVYLGAAAQQDGPVSVLPLAEFMRRLAEGGIVGDSVVP